MEKRYNSFVGFFREKYGCRLQKLVVDAGFTCPNRDGSISRGGCTFCDNNAFHPNYSTSDKSITQQLDEGIEFHRGRYRGVTKYLAYFQPYSNTYAPLERLRQVYGQALSHPDVVGIVVGTRPDCVDEEKLDYLASLKDEGKVVVVEYGIESCYDTTLKRINRGHTFAAAREAVRMSSDRGLLTGAHFILGLPGETKEDMLMSASLINSLPLDSVKFHQLQIIKGTAMEREYAERPEDFVTWTLDEYIDFFVDMLERLRPDLLIERFAGEVPPRFVNSTPWGLVRNTEMLRMLDKRLELRGSRQGVLESAVLKSLSAALAVSWTNPKYDPACDESFLSSVAGVSASSVADASARLLRFAPLIEHYFPETRADGGIIESPLAEIPSMKNSIEKAYGCRIGGRLLLKMDSHLAVSGSVKARGGIYEVLKHTEDLALEGGIISGGNDDYLKLASPAAREFFSKHKVQVGSTGNLGLSIGIMASALGYRAIVHMSSDARQWKKDLLRSRGATVCEYDGDYGEAVACGRRLSDADPMSYFVDDEQSRDLFYGYAVAGERVKRQLDDMGIRVDADHPLYVYIPCGVGGAPGGIIYGLKMIFGADVRCYLAEPVQAPCMLAGLASGLMERISVQDLGLSGVTAADGLAVGRPSSFVGRVLDTILSGETTVEDSRLLDYLRLLKGSEDILIEPSACASFAPLVSFSKETFSENATHIVWATGGSMVPDSFWHEIWERK